ncbi:hypothetical protein B0H10DRAFT_508854 [Mycena sp. CBHHK59/15]|nr:hypothetical protein B0H10DRAFT_508854 [Mycena sp. CBHHK59/15]
MPSMQALMCLSFAYICLPYLLSNSQAQCSTHARARRVSSITWRPTCLRTFTASVQPALDFLAPRSIAWAAWRHVHRGRSVRTVPLVRRTQHQWPPSPGRSSRFPRQ